MLTKTLKLGTLSFAAGLAMSSALMAQNVTLNYATNTPPNNVRGEAESIFLEELETASGGEISVVPYWGSSLIQGREILGGVRDGITEMGFVNINYYPNQLLLNSAFNLFPKGPSDYEDIVWSFEQMYERIPELNEEFANQGQRIVHMYGVTPYAGVFKSEVTSLEAMEGLRVRAASRWYLNLLEGAGATPVSMPWGDLYQGLQTGAIDGVFTNLDGIHRASLDEAAQNVFFVPDLWLAIPFAITINESKWQSLTDEQKAAFELASERATARYSEIWNASIEDILQAQRDAGYTVNVAAISIADAFAELPEVANNQATWATEARDAGVSDPEAILEQFRTVISEAVAR
ncbi:hypothetical protein E1180_14235 [Roseibium denhamense]|uniref:TRAP-type C4-dicarboxylate transport system, substrate-binding protein n=1 Tax=Roseibium denhamense TaxID=76305 RepID=A0ABY1ND12_9HYPH|nr:TRAP transporter substrate-binding protein DctP [Roseibium denhamense]MTI06676.1 hypothetical protein [Roseibium denhamense]SMP06607.1 TRAP-type C4-dicarboxylate transport system, substrate-binding protein [Roseibium denhamense]